MIVDKDMELRELFGDFYPGTEDEYLDPGQLLEQGLADVSATAGGVGRLMARLHELTVRDADEEGVAEAVYDAGLRWESLEGGSLGEYLHGVIAFIALRSPQFRATGHSHDDRALPRVSTFTDKDTANSAATQVVRANERSLRAWVADQDGHARWVGHYDIGTTIGRIMTAGVEGTADTTALTAVMRMDPASGNPYIQTCYPELVLDQAIRATYPDLCHVMGGYFGQDWDAEDVTLWGAQRAFLHHTTGRARDHVRDQLDALIAVPDAELVHTLTHLGCYVRPASDARLRGWIERMRWRMDAFDWTTAT